LTKCLICDRGVVKWWWYEPILGGLHERLCPCHKTTICPQCHYVFECKKSNLKRYKCTDGYVYKNEKLNYSGVLKHNTYFHNDEQN
jgi:hypothetical protein